MKMRKKPNDISLMSRNLWRKSHSSFFFLGFFQVNRKLPLLLKTKKLLSRYVDDNESLYCRAIVEFYCHLINLYQPLNQNIYTYFAHIKFVTFNGTEMSEQNRKIGNHFILCQLKLTISSNSTRKSQWIPIELLNFIFISNHFDISYHAVKTTKCSSSLLLKWISPKNHTEITYFL